MTGNAKPVGIIAGYGRFPVIVAKEARQQGFKTVVISIDGTAESEIKKFSDVLETFPVEKLGAIIEKFKSEGVSQAVMAGKIGKATIFRELQPDGKALEAVQLMKDFSDDNIIRAVAEIITREGIELMDATFCTSSLKAEEGVLSARPPTPDEKKNIDFGWRMAKELGRLDVGQSAIVKGLAVIALEAIEGTDKAILRAGELAGEGTVVVKVSKPNQDLRFDAPVIGPNTISSMVKAGSTAIAIEAEKSIILDKSEALDIANKADIAVVAMKAPREAR